MEVILIRRELLNDAKPSLAVASHHHAVIYPPSLRPLNGQAMARLTRSCLNDTITKHSPPVADLLRCPLPSCFRHVRLHDQLDMTA
jgi:hypothetical protein